MFQPELLAQVQAPRLVAPVGLVVPVLRLYAELGVHPDSFFIDGRHKHDSCQLVFFPDLLEVESQLQALFFLLVQ